MVIPVINRILKTERKKRGLTQEKTAELLFKSTGTIKRYDTGDIIPESVLQQLCNILNLDLSNLLLKQQLENSKNNTMYYNRLISKRNLYGSNFKEIEDEYYKKIQNEDIDEKKIIKVSEADNLNSFSLLYDIRGLRVELLNYLNFKDDFFKLETTKEEKRNKIEKILSFIDFLYFQDIIKK